MHVLPVAVTQDVQPDALRAEGDGRGRRPAAAAEHEVERGAALVPAAGEAMRVAKQTPRDVPCRCRCCGFACGHVKRNQLRVLVGVTLGEPYRSHGGMRVRVRWDHGQTQSPLVRDLFPMEGWA